MADQAAGITMLRWFVGCAIVLAATLLNGAVAQTPPNPQPAAADAAPHQDEQAGPPIIDARFYEVGQFSVELSGTADSDLPSTEEMLQLEVALHRSPTGFEDQPREGLEEIRFKIADAASQPTHRYTLGALNSISTQLVKFLNSRGVIGVRVALPQINDGGDDLRSGTTDLTLLVLVARVSQVRTQAIGDERIDVADRIDSKDPVHARIREQSPVKPGDVLHKNVIDEYMFRLSRYPGRRVDLALSASDQQGEVVLDYLIAENRPLLLYGQLSNTGTANTDSMRERFGLIHNQLTKADDILSLDFVTASFDSTNAFLGSYERPIPGLEWQNAQGAWRNVRGRVYGSWSEYTASDVGIASEVFTGESWSAGAEAGANFYQNQELFIDGFLGARWENITVNNELIAQEGEADVFVPYLGVRAERIKQNGTTLATVSLEFTLNDITGTSVEDLTRLGRSEPDEDWQILRWDISQSISLEWLLLGEEKWLDPKVKGSKLAHEIVATFKGQYAFENRLIPQAEQVIGGLYTVRGYPESVVAGDTTLIGSLEYRFHVPRAFTQAPPAQSAPSRDRGSGGRGGFMSQVFGQQFRFAPQEPFGTADWDLVLKAFVDAGQAIISDPASFESDESLLSAGVGVEFLYKRNINFRVDWGFVLKDLDDQNVNSGSNRCQFVVTFLY